MVENKREQIQEMKDQIGEAEFFQTLSYYNLRVVKDSILCPIHNDRHYESCKIMKNRKNAYCFVCQKSIDAIDLVSYFEGYGFVDAINYLWTDILGRELPRIQSKHRKKKRFLSFAELQYVGLAPRMNKHALCIENEIFRMDDPPVGYVIDWEYMDEEGNCPIGKPIPRCSMYDLYEENAPAAIYIVDGKIQEAKEICYDQLKESRDIETELGYLCTNNKSYAKEIRKELRSKLNQLNKISAKLEKAAM